MHKHFTNPSDQKQGPNCGVTATAICAGVSFNRAWNVYKTLGKAYYAKRNWKGGTFTRDQATALRKLGIEWHDVDFNRCNLKTLVATLERGKVYMITTTSHVQTVTVDERGNGFVVDQQGVKSIDDYWGKKKFVTKIREIHNPFKNAVEREQVIDAQKRAPAPIPTQSHDTLFPSLFEDKRKTAHSSAQQLTLF